MKPRYLPIVHYGGPLLATASVREVCGDSLEPTYATPAAAWRRAARELEALTKRAAAESTRCRRVVENLEKKPAAGYRSVGRKPRPVRGKPKNL